MPKPPGVSLLWGKKLFDHGEELLVPGGMDLVAGAFDRDEATSGDQLAQRLRFFNGPR